MKKIIISIFFIIVAVTAWSQNLKGYQVEALQMLKAKRAFVIGGDTLFSTTQTSGIDTTFVTLEYLRDSLKITEGQIIDFGDYQTKLNGIGFVKADGTTISYDNTVYKSDNANLNTVNWSVKDALTHYHAINKGQFDSVFNSLNENYLPKWDGAKFANSYIKNTTNGIDVNNNQVLMEYNGTSDYSASEIILRPKNQAVPGAIGRIQNNLDAVGGQSYYTYIANGATHTHGGAANDFKVYNQYVKGQIFAMNMNGWHFMYANASTPGNVSATTVLSINSSGQVSGAEATLDTHYPQWGQVKNYAINGDGLTKDFFMIWDGAKLINSKLKYSNGANLDTDNSRNTVLFNSGFRPGGTTMPPTGNFIAGMSFYSGGYPDARHQFAFGSGFNEMYLREYHSGVGTDWAKLYHSQNSNIATVNWTVKDATTQYHAVNKGQLDAISTKLGTLSTSFLPYWDGAKLANSHLKTVGSVIQYDSEKVFSNPRDIVDKSYVDAIASGNLPKLPVDVATTGNITLSGLQTIDGYSIASGQRVLVKNQTTASQNGVYIAASGAWTRSADLDSWDELYKAYVAVLSGGQSGSSFVCNIPASGTLGTTPITWVLYSAPTNIIPGNGLVRVGNVFSADYGGTGSAFTLSRSDHKHTVSDITNFPAFGTTAGTIAEGNDSRILNGQTAFGWGNHTDAGYLTTETDPIWNVEKTNYFTKLQVTGLPVSTFNNDIGYLTTADIDSEVDPIFTTSEAANITATDITNLSNLSGVNTGDQDLSGLASKIALKDSAAQVRSEIPNVSGFTTKIALKDSTALIRSEIPTNNNQLINGAGYLTSVTFPDELDPIWNLEKVNYFTKTQVNNLPISTFDNDAGFITSSSLPTINNSTITLQGSAVTGTPQTFNLNQSVAKAITINNTTYSAGTGMALNGTTFNHSNGVTAGTASEGGITRNLVFGGKFNIPSVTYDSQGHITGNGSIELTLPANPTSGTNTGDVTLTTTGNSGAATLTGQALNIPNYTLSGLGGEKPLTFSTGLERTLNAVVNTAIPKTIYNPSDGVLIATDIPSASATMFTLHIDGNGYTFNKFEINTQGYNWEAIVQYRGHSVNYDLPIYYFIYNGFLHIWLARTTNAQTFNCTVLSGSTSPTGTNRITGITNSVKPTTGVTKEVSFTPKKIWTETNSNLSTVNWSVKDATAQHHAVNLGQMQSYVKWSNVTDRPTKVSDFTNDAGYLTSVTFPDETDPIFTAWDKSYFDLINKPNFKDSISTYQVPTDLSNYTQFTDLDTLSFLRKETDPIWMAQKVDYYTKTQVNGLLPTVNNPTITFAGTAVVGSPQTITLNQSAAKTITLNAPTVPDQLPSDWEATTGVTRILNKPTLFSGSYVDLTNKPTIPTNNNQLTNGAGYITAAEVTTPTLQSVTDAGAITTKAITALNVTISGTPINANHAVRITDLSTALSDYYQKSEVNGLPVSTFTNNAGYLTTETDPIFTAWDKDYNDLINKPAPIVVAGDSINAHVAGTINGTNNNFTTYANFIAGTTMVYVNGVRQEKGFHYNEGGTTQINFISPYTPRTDERIIIDYKY